MIVLKPGLDGALTAQREIVQPLTVLLQCFQWMRQAPFQAGYPVHKRVEPLIDLACQQDLVALQLSDQLFAAGTDHFCGS